MENATIVKTYISDQRENSHRINPQRYPPACLKTKIRDVLGRRNYRLCLPPRLHNGGPPAVLVHRLDVVSEPKSQTCDTEEPEDYAEGLGHAEFQSGGLGFQMEGDHDCDADYGHVNAEAQV